MASEFYSSSTLSIQQQLFDLDFEVIPTSASTHLISNSNTIQTVVSTHTREIFDLVNFVTISAAIGVFGIWSNIINIVVFIKQGLSDVITISLFALAVSDLLGLVAMEIYDVFINPYFLSAELPFLPSELKYILAAWPHSCFIRITCLITAFVTLERCICIVFPLKVNQILSPTRVAIIIATLSIGVFISVIPAYMTVELGWKTDEDRNRTILGVSIRDDAKQIADIAFVVNCIMQFVAFGSVVVSTAILVMKIKEQSIWRNSMKSTGNDAKGQQNTISPKDKKLIRMVIMISVILILCCTPGSSFFTTALIIPGFSSKGEYRNIYQICWSFAFITDAINPSVSIFVYYHMSSNYRSTFRQLFSRWFKDGQSSNESAHTTVSKFPEEE